MAFNAFARTAIPLTAVSITTMSLTMTEADAKASNVNLSAVRKDIVDTIDTNADKRGDGTALTGTFVRLAWHCAGTYAKKDNSGGSNGARMRYSPEAKWGANAGLDLARNALEPVKAKHPEISYADLYTLAGAVAIEESSSGDCKVPFRLGREDFASGETSPPDGRLPDADKGSMPKTVDHVRCVFNRMGFNDREMVALVGAHALGRCHTDASGYWGPWTNAETTFSNEYFRLLAEEEWTLKKTHNGKKWTGPEQYEDKTGNLMMLPADIALIKDPKFAEIVKIYAKDEEAFFKDFGAAFSKLLELGVPFPKPWWKVWA